MHMSAEPSPLHDIMTKGVMHSVAMTIMYPLIHYACMAFKRVLGYSISVLFSADQCPSKSRGRGRTYYSIKL
jgi:hypothetical protein